ncbi:SDR family NAD(P)-dependent oxidoreductase [Chloroflexota bacterium]
MGKLDGKVAIVTGGGTGIGLNIAIDFAKAGADVVVTSRKLVNLEKAVKEIEALGKRPLAIATDVRFKDQVQNMVKRTIDELGKVDILVNNAGINIRCVLPEMTGEMWDGMIDTNLKGVFLCTQAVAPYMMKQKYGKIINMASMAGRGWNHPGTSCYSASKAGVIELTRCYARELGSYNINVNAIAPGYVLTDINIVGRTPEEVEAAKERSRKAAVIGRTGTTQDIAPLVLFLASDDSSYITGQTIPIDGGRTDRM